MSESKTMRARWEYYPNETRATLHVDVPMFLGGYFSSDRGKLPVDQRKLLETIEAIPGVREVHTSKYQLSVQRGGVFGWDEIQPHVEQAVAAWAGCDEVERQDCVARGCWLE